MARHSLHSMTSTLVVNPGADAEREQRVSFTYRYWPGMPATRWEPAESDSADWIDVCAEQPGRVSRDLDGDEWEAFEVWWSDEGEAEARRAMRRVMEAGR